MGALEELARVYEEAKRDPKFWAELDALLKDYVGRPTPITETPRLAAQVGSGVVVLLKREDLNHTGAHKINNTLGQVLLARRMGKRRIIAETGAGQHGVATRSEEHTSELQSRSDLVCRLLLEKKKKNT